MSDTVIRVENLSKRYRIGGSQGHFKYGSLRDSLVNAAKAPFRRLRSSSDSENKTHGYIWALKDVSFEVKQGDVLGIIGRNGAGKTTLLKILSRITKPTEGQVRLRGRVGSLLEVGTGFHPELTGRENIFLNGAVLGMKRVEIDRKFDEIVDFAEIEQFLDTPVKHYSSGMYMRLAFAVAAHLEPEILLVDEVLAVGDTAFQKKCLGKMGEISKEGRTVLFVSHNMDSVQLLTHQCLLLERGFIAFLGNTTDAIDIYIGHSTRTCKDLDDFRQHKRSKDVYIDTIQFNGKNAPTSIEFGSRLQLDFNVISKIHHPNVCVTVIISDRIGRNITTLCSLDHIIELPIKKGGNHFNVEIQRINFAPGFYTLDIALNPSFTEHAWDVIRRYPLGEILVGSDFKNTSLVISNRTWGVIHTPDVKWNVI